MKTTAEKILVMQAYERGEKVEMWSDARGKWVLLENPEWGWGIYDYRIATKPLECLVIFKEDKPQTVIKDETAWYSTTGCRVVKMREVI